MNIRPVPKWGRLSAINAPYFLSGMRAVINSVSYPTEFPVYPSLVRKELEAQIVARIDKERIVLIRGSYRTGKSSILTAISKAFTARGVAVMQENASLVHIKNSDEWFKKKIAQFIAAAKGPSLMLAIDEATGLRGNKLAPEYLNSLTREFPDLRLVLVIHSINEGDSLIRDYFPDASSFTVGPVTREETRTLVLSPFKKSPFFGELVTPIHDFCGGVPYMINGFCRYVKNLIEEETTMQNILDKIEALFKETPSELDIFFSYVPCLKTFALLRRLTPEDKRLFKDLLAGVQPQANEERLKYLSDIGLLRSSIGNDYEINVGALEAFYRHLLLTSALASK